VCSSDLNIASMYQQYWSNSASLVSYKEYDEVNKWLGVYITVS